METALSAGILLIGCFFASFAEMRTRSSAFPSADDQRVVLVGAGDIADCTDLSGAEATAKLLDQVPGTVMAVGDLAYPEGSKENFECYNKTWGRTKSRTRPRQSRISFCRSHALFRLFRRCCR